MLETPARTPEQAYEALSLIGGRFSLALNEARRRLETELPPLIDLANTRASRSGLKAIELPKDYYIAPEKLTDNYLNCVLVGGSVNKVPQGTRGFKNEALLTVYIVNQRIETPSQTDDAWDRSDLATAVLHGYLSGCADLQGRWAWRQLIPLSQEMLPAEYAEYSGVALNYKCVQSHSDEFWN